ncbi:MAG: protein kinase, partial [Pseudomonadota bacterium]|nr:protein kinase [Pseudomonadota bacterium]
MAIDRPPLRRLAARPLDCAGCGSAVDSEDVACARCGVARPASGWRVVGGPRVAVAPSPERKRTVPVPMPVQAPKAAEEHPARPAPLRLRVRPPADEVELDEFDFAADVVEIGAEATSGKGPTGRQLAAGQVYGGRYRVEEVLGQSPGADRYVAIQEPLVRRVVLTVLSADRPTDAQQALESRFLREARVLSRMRHPSLAPVHETGRAPNGTCFVTEELLYGFTLAELYERGALEPERLVAIAADVAGALAALHEAGVLHRCLRADQVVVGPRVWRGGAGAEVAQVGRYAAEVTPEHVADNEDAEAALAWPPEVIAGQEPDETADIYAVGVLLYRALAGRPPYEGTASSIMGARTTSAPPPLVRDRDGGLADRLRDVADRCLQATPERRYPSARALLAELEGLARAPKVVPVAPVPVPVAVAVAPAGLPVSTTILAAVAGAFVPTMVAIALLVYLPLRPAPSAPPSAPTAVVGAPEKPVAAAIVAPVAAPVEAPVGAPVGSGVDAAVEVVVEAPPVAAPPPVVQAPAPTSRFRASRSSAVAAAQPEPPPPATVPVASAPAAAEPPVALERALERAV